MVDRDCSEVEAHRLVLVDAACVKVEDAIVALQAPDDVDVVGL